MVSRWFEGAPAFQVHGCVLHAFACGQAGQELNHIQTPSDGVPAATGTSTAIYNPYYCKEILSCQCHATSLWKAKTRARSKDHAKSAAIRARSWFKLSTM